MAHAVNTFKTSERHPAIPLGKIRELYDDSKSVLDRFIEINPLEAGYDDPEQLVKLTSDVKSTLGSFCKQSELLVAKLMTIAAASEAQAVREERHGIRREVKEFVMLINVVLRKFNHEEMSAVDTDSVRGSIGGPEYASKGQMDGKTCSNLLVESAVPAGGDCDVGASDNHVGGRYPTPSVGGDMTTFKKLLSPRPPDEYAPSPLKFLYPNASESSSSYLENGINTTTSVRKPSVKFSNLLGTSGGTPVPPQPSVIPKSKSCYKIPFNDPISASYRGPEAPKCRTSYHQQINPEPPRENFPWNGSRVEPPAIDAASQHLLKQELMRKAEEPYNGEPYKFKSWKMMLDNRMKNLQLDAIDVIAILSANTVGEPKKMVERYKAALDLDPRGTLDRLWSALSRRFGSSVQVCTALCRKLEEFPVVRPPDVKGKLSDLADLCRLIEMNMVGNPELLIFNVSLGQYKVWSRLPDHLQHRWRSIGHDHTSRHDDHIPPFSSLVDFLERQADELNNPYFCGNYNLEAGPVKEKFTRERSARVYKTNAEISNYCAYHKKPGHTVYKCNSFEKLVHADKIKFARQERLCFNCLLSHYASSCDTEVRCNVCSGSHCTVMHYNNNGQKNLRVESDDQAKINVEKHSERVLDASTHCTSLCGDPESRKSCSKTLLCDVFHRDRPETVHRCYVIIDEQSNSSFISPSAVEKLNASGPRREFTVTTLNSYKTRHSGLVIGDLCVRGVQETGVHALPVLRTSDLIPDSRDEVATPEIVRAHRHISHLAPHFVDFDPSADVSVLLGRDCGDLLRTRCHGTTYPFAHKTPIGWALVGSSCIDKESKANNKNVDHEHFIVNKCLTRKAPYTPLKDCFRELPDDDEAGLSQEDQIFLEKFEDSVCINKKGNISIGLPFRDSEVKLPNNQQAVYCRTRNTLNRLRSNPQVLGQCLEAMGKNLSLNHVEVVPLEELTPTPGRAWWLPIFVHINPKKEKPRLVFDSSASYGGTSLNNVLLQGPDDCNRLRGVLMRFRHGEIGFSADIEAMFYNFYLLPSDKDFVRFYWYQDNDPKKKLIQYRGCVHLFGNKPSPAIAQCGLNFAVSQNMDDVEKTTSDFISRNFYVDDALAASRTVEEAKSILVGARAILSKYNIRLHKISSNSSELLKYFPESEIDRPATDCQLGVSDMHRTLGLAWNIERDELSTFVNVHTREFTRRGLLSVLGSLYDPLGVYNPVTNKGKSILRETMLLCKVDGVTNYDWDDDLPTEHATAWKKWVDSLPSLVGLRLPRSYIPSGFGEVVRRELHVFSDASEEAIGAVAYLRLTGSDGSIAVSYVLSKSKLTPRAATTIPRAELCAAVEAASLCREVSNELGVTIDGTYMYTDSSVVIGYLNNKEKRFTNYVARRIQTIIKVVPANLWEYIATSLNPADIASRFHTPDTLMESSWMSGPEFLYLSSEPDHAHAPLIEELPEEKTIRVLKITVDTSPVSEMLKRTNNLAKAVNRNKIVISFVYRIVDAYRQKCGISIAPRNTNINYDLSLQTLIRCVQQHSFADLYHDLQSSSDKIPSRFSSLDPFMDDGVIRVGGRLSGSHLFHSQKFPVLLPSSHNFTDLVVHYYHESTGHQGRHLTSGALRNAGYHVFRGTKVISNLVNKCVTCRKLRGTSPVQLMADLPMPRVEDVVPFHNSGVDVFGHFLIADGKTTRRTSGSKKVWVILFTCMASRAVHVDLLDGLDTSSFKNALRRFMSIRGSCKNLYSDRGTNFVSSSSQDSAVDIREVSKDLEDRDCVWHFNTPHASHHGGTWERKIGAIRRVLEGGMVNLKGTILSRDEFSTLVCEAMSVVNNTPLWGVSCDPKDPSPISPAMLLTLRDRPNPPSLHDFTERDVALYGKVRWRKVQYIAECFWRQWRAHYLSSLQERRKWMKRKRNLVVNDVVLLKDRNAKRNMWPTGLVSSVKLKDGIVRSVTIDIVVGKGKDVTRRSYERPISEVVLLIPFEERR